jgi:hypothetical protein
MAFFDSPSYNRTVQILIQIFIILLVVAGIVLLLRFIL